MVVCHTCIHYALNNSISVEIVFHAKTTRKDMTPADNEIIMMYTIRLQIKLVAIFNKRAARKIIADPKIRTRNEESTWSNPFVFFTRSNQSLDCNIWIKVKAVSRNPKKVSEKVDNRSIISENAFDNALNEIKYEMTAVIIRTASEVKILIFISCLFKLKKWRPFMIYFP
jgi:hypothetical protein